MKKKVFVFCFCLLFFKIAAQNSKDIDINYPYSYYQNTSNQNKVKLSDVEYILCEEANDEATFNLTTIGNYVLNNSNIFNIEPEVLICDSGGNIKSIKDLDNSTPTINTICSNISPFLLFDIGVDSNSNIYVSTDGFVYKTFSDCSYIQVSNYPSSINALSFDLDDNMYINSGATVLRASINSLNSFNLWHDFGIGISSGDFVILGDKMYIAWRVSGSDHLYEITIDSNYNYISHIDLGVLPINTFGLASELGVLYGVTPNQLYKINLVSFTFETIISNSTTDAWYGAAGIHEALNLDITFFNSLSDALSNSSPITVGDFTTESTTVYMLITNIETGESEIVSIDLTVILNLEAIDNVEECNSYTLPALTVGNYFTTTNGGGTMLNAGDVITNTQTLFVFEESNTKPNCISEVSFVITINTAPNIVVPNITSGCDSYTLPNLSVGNYYTETNGGGIMLNAGDVITSSQTIYIYAKVGITPNICSDEDTFVITINSTPTADFLSNSSVCNSFTLPSLSANNNYYTETNGGGTVLNAGDVINNTQTIYIYSEVGTAPNLCTSENSFTITVNALPNFVTPPTTLFCDSFTLPSLNVGNYFTATNGGGVMLNAGDLITSSQTIYIYAEVGNAPNICSVEESFTITIINVPNTGISTEIILCKSQLPINLLDALDGNPSNGGVWTGSSTLFGGDMGVFDPAVDIAGKYTYTIINGFCSSNSTVTVQLFGQATITAIEVYNYSSNNSAAIHTTGISNYEYSIDGVNFQTSNVFENLASGEYSIFVRDVFNHCEIIESDTFSIFTIPNFFTPNNDGQNDEWKIEGLSNQINSNVTIFDRFGKVIKILTFSDNNWNGTYLNKELPSSDYWYVLRTFNSKGDPIFRKDHFSLIRR